jgi:hypothetical protein
MIRLDRITTGSIYIFWHVIWNYSLIGFISYDIKTGKFKWEDGGWQWADVKFNYNLILELKNEAIEKAKEEVTNDAIVDILLT